MADKFWIALVALWIERVYYWNEKWDRLRTIGKVKTLVDGIEDVIFFPVRQCMPAINEHTHPEMKDPQKAHFLSSFNTVSDACDFMNEPYRCNLQQEPSEKLGKKLKYQLRKSNISYPNLFTDITDVPSQFSPLDRSVPQNNPYWSYIPIIDIHAYDNNILIAGGPIAHAGDWPKGFQVMEVDYSGWSYNGISGDNILLPSNINDEDFGEVVKAVWMSRKNSLASIDNI